METEKIGTEEIKLSPPTDDRFYIENPREFTKILLD
jgi:hypothetical protein